MKQLWMVQTGQLTYKQSLGGGQNLFKAQRKFKMSGTSDPLLQACLHQPSTLGALNIL